MTAILLRLIVLIFYSYLQESATMKNINLMNNDFGEEGAEALAQALHVSTVKPLYRPPRRMVLNGRWSLRRDLTNMILMA